MQLRHARQRLASKVDCRAQWPRAAAASATIPSYHGCTAQFGAARARQRGVACEQGMIRRREPFVEVINGTPTSPDRPLTLPLSPSDSSLLPYELLAPAAVARDGVGSIISTAAANFPPLPHFIGVPDQKACTTSGARDLDSPTTRLGIYRECCVAYFACRVVGRLVGGCGQWIALETQGPAGRRVIGWVYILRLVPSPLGSG